MCEIFGVSSRIKVEINEYLKTFFSHSDKHPHGWGLACMDGNETNIEKEPIKATDSKYLHSRLSVPICVTAGFAHIRYATIGNIFYSNCHPFVEKDSSGRRWTMIHNGTIFEYEPMNSYIKKQNGDTDSERILLYIVDLINDALQNKGQDLSAEERFELVNQLVIDLSVGNKLNLLLFDGEYMYVHSNYKGTIHYLQKDDAVYFSTQPLSREKWKELPSNQLQVYRDGKLVYQGTVHNNEYVDDAEKVKYLYQIFSEL